MEQFSIRTTKKKKKHTTVAATAAPDALHPIAADEVFKNYSHTIRCAIEYGRIDYSAEECFMVGVVMFRRLIKKTTGRWFDDRELEREVDRIVYEYAGANNNAMTTLALLICRVLLHAVAMSDQYENIQPFGEYMNLDKILSEAIKQTDNIGIDDIWHKAAMLVGTVYPEEEYTHYRLPELIADCHAADTKGEIASLVETTIGSGNLADCEALKNLLLNFDHTHDNRYKAEVDTLIEGINRLRQPARTAYTENNHYYSAGSTHDDHSKHLSMGELPDLF